MDPSDPVAPYLPTLGRARAEGLALPTGAPVEERRVAALVVLAFLVRREGWTEVVDLSPKDALQIATDEPPLPDALEFEARAHRRLAEHLGPRPCTACAGASASPVVCASCMGEGHLRRVRIRHVQDRPFEVRELYAPREMSFVPALFAFVSALKRALGDADFPEALRCLDLRPRAVRTAYRGGGDRMVEPDFHGHQFAGTIESAVATLDAFAAGGRIVAQEVRAYAWPLLWLRYGPGEPARDEVVFPELTGALQAFSGANPAELESSSSGSRRSRS
ncbi:hypothetical protein [Sorangium sp. So ce128]|uniref:hypothetical protein n=1 Tax=Sorangium sp. So ce128 TaxID=3133281 RepID=UPI003F6188F0